MHASQQTNKHKLRHNTHMINREQQTTNKHKAVRHEEQQTHQHITKQSTRTATITKQATNHITHKTKYKKARQTQQ